MFDVDRPFRFLQLSDILLDARFSFNKLKMSASKRFERNQEALRALGQLCQMARLERLDALVVTGNLWDGQCITASTAGKVVEAFASMGDIPAIIVPGSADPYTSQSLYNPKVLSAYALGPWSRNVHIFQDDDYSFFRHPLRTDVVFCGRANVGSVPKSQPPQRFDATISQARYKILLDFQPLAGADPGAGFDFNAFGGMANHFRLVSNEGQTCGAAAGSLIGRTTDEGGVRSALLVELSQRQMQGSRTSSTQVNIERVPADFRQIVSLTVNLNGVKSADVAEFLKRQVELSKARQGSDMVHLKIMGMYTPPELPDFSEHELSRQFYHVAIENAMRPDYFIERTGQQTAAGQFIKEIQELKHKAEMHGGALTGTEYGVEVNLRDLEDALYYGLEALNQKVVTIKDVD